MIVEIILGIVVLMLELIFRNNVKIYSIIYILNSILVDSMFKLAYDNGVEGKIVSIILLMVIIIDTYMFGRVLRILFE